MNEIADDADRRSRLAMAELRRIRKRRCVRIRVLSGKTSMSIRRLSVVERGLSPVKVHEFLAIAAALELEPEHVLGWVAEYA